MDYENHPTFCLYPWVHRLIDTHGFLQLCCRDQGEPIGHVQDMGEDWNGPVMRDIRQKLVDGEKISACNDCWKQEAFGKVSHRQFFTRNWINLPGVRGVVDRSLKADMWVDAPPLYIEVRFGNLCNLTCKMCIGHSSTQVMKDAKKLKQLDPEGYNEFIPHEDGFLGIDYAWYDDADNWEQIDQIIPYLRHITITGGEPTLIKKNMQFLRRIIDLGFAKQINVDITTNLTNINDDFLDLMSKFNLFHVAFSLDGYGDHYEYIRYPAKWDTIEENMKRVMARTYDCDTITVGVHMVVQLFNILYLPDILDKLFGLMSEYSSKFPKFISSVVLTTIHHPMTFNLSGAPDIVKAVALTRLEEWLDTNSHSEEVLDLLPTGSLDMIRNELQHEEYPQRAKRVLDYCKFLDQNKKVRLQGKIPELARLLEVACH